MQYDDVMGTWLKKTLNPGVDLGGGGVEGVRPPQIWEVLILLGFLGYCFTNLFSFFHNVMVPFLSWTLHIRKAGSAPEISNILHTENVQSEWGSLTNYINQYFNRMYAMHQCVETTVALPARKVAYQSTESMQGDLCECLKQSHITWITVPKINCWMKKKTTTKKQQPKNTPLTN